VNKFVLLQIKVVYAMQTLVGVIRAVYRKCAQLSGFDLVNFLIGTVACRVVDFWIQSIFSANPGPTLQFWFRSGFGSDLLNQLGSNLYLKTDPDPTFYSDVDPD
jgi:hypothetical protein